MPWNTNPAGTSLNIAAYPGTQLRVVAGPGTGKTYALMRRVARLLEQNVQPDRVLAVSFTRTAANDLSTRNPRETRDRIGFCCIGGNADARLMANWQQGKSEESRSPSIVYNEAPFIEPILFRQIDNSCIELRSGYPFPESTRAVCVLCAKSDFAI